VRAHVFGTSRAYARHTRRSSRPLEIIYCPGEARTRSFHWPSLLPRKDAGVERAPGPSPLSPARPRPRPRPRPRGVHVSLEASAATRMGPGSLIARAVSRATSPITIVRWVKLAGARATPAGPGGSFSGSLAGESRRRCQSLFL
jgi:hypothetical protein